MWRHLRLTGLGVIDEAALELGPGLTVITGETGAGKTMVVTALGLLRGDRADSSLIRHGAPQARIEAEIEAGPPIEQIVEDVAGEIEDGVVLLSRVLTAQGRSRAYLGGASVPATVLAAVSEHAVAVHGQADQYRLLRPSAQREALDAFAGDELAGVLERYRRDHRRFTELRARLAEIRGSAQERARELDQLRFGLSEIEQIAPQAGEDRELDAESARLAHAETLLEAARQAHGLLAGGEDDLEGAAAALARAATVLEQAQEHDAALGALVGRVREASYLVADAAADLATYLGDLDLDPARIEQVERRRADLARLTRKYGEDLDQVLTWADRARDRVGELDLDDTALDELAAQVESLGAELVERAAAITARRREAAERLTGAVGGELADLALPHGRLRVVVDAPTEPTVDDLGPAGVDTVEFLFSANSGIDPRPLAKGASGGELSRVMLALEVVLTDRRTVPTLVFDEVDAGIGGKAAVEVGRRLARLARGSQVLAVTHLPQVAAFADHHFHVEKSHDGAVTRSSVVHLAGDARVDELSRMLAGLDDSDSAQAHARELLALAAEARP